MARGRDVRRATLERALDVAIDLGVAAEKIDALARGVEAWDEVRARVVAVLDEWAERYAVAPPAPGMLADDITDALTDPADGTDRADGDTA